MGGRPLIDPRVGRKYQYVVAGFVLCLVFAFSGATLLAVLGATLVRYRIYAADFVPTTCTGFGVERLGNKGCSCGDGCRSSYPCVKVFANYQTTSGLAVAKATIYGDQDDLFGASGCSIKKCSRSIALNSATVMSFVNEYSNGSYSCFYNPSTHSEALTSRDTSILHYLLWPSLVFVLFGAATAALTPSCVKAVKKSRQIRAADKVLASKPSPTIQGSTNAAYSAGSDSVALGGQQGYPAQAPPAYSSPDSYWQPQKQTTAFTYSS